MKVKIFSIILFSFLLKSSYADRAIDSIRKVIKISTNDSIKGASYYNLSFTCINDPNKVLEVISEMELFCERIQQKKLYAYTLRKIGTIYHRLNYFDRAMEFYIKAAEVYQKNEDKIGVANCYNNIANAYTSKGELTNDILFFDRAIEYHKKCINLHRNGGDTTQLTNSFNNIGISYMHKEEYTTALEYFKRAYNSYVKLEVQNGIDISTLNLGDVYLKIALKDKNPDNFNKALFYYNDRLKFYSGNTNNERLSQVLTKIGQIFSETGKHREGIEYLLKGWTMANAIKNQASIMEAALQLSIAYEKSDEFKKSVEYSRLYNIAKDSLLNSISRADMERMQALFQSTQKDKEIEKLGHEKQLQTAQLNRNRTIIFSSVGGFLLLLVLGFVLLSRYNLKKKANVQLTSAYEKIETKNKQITDSINYARRIQNAILPPNELIESHLQNFFVFYSPKDIVSGDFYWFSNHKNKLFFVVADCTGHGVPGALMSMIGNTLLGEIINQENILDPGEILTHLNKGVTLALHQQGNDVLKQDDGMDISICCLDENDKSKLKYASANHTIFIKNKNSITELKGDIFSIGGSIGNENKKFLTNEIKMEKDSTVIMSTDGYYDQFGGTNDSKFLMTNFEELILKTDFSKTNVAEEFKTAFENWKNETRQTDDVLVAGFKI